MSIGGAAHELNVPPIETLTSNPPCAVYSMRSGTAGSKTKGASIGAATGIAAGSVLREPSNGNPTSPGHAAAAR